MGGPHGEIKWISSVKNTNNISCTNVQPKYSLFGERIRHVAPTNLQCSMFCGGKQCKYCNPAKFSRDEMAIKGLYSSWVTDNILATSRPTTIAVKEYKVIEQFKTNGILSIINLQHSGEHGACGFGLDEESGFSYSPKEFMDNDVFFYNFGWNDYGVRSLHSILDMVKVMDFALTNGKVAIHCHAGLGRTGVLIACYLIYSQRLTAKQAILKVRNSRPKAIQTRGQITCVTEFHHFIEPMWIHFTEDGDSKVDFIEYMSNQRSLLHGEEARTLRYIPKICFVICQRLLVLAEIDFDLSTVAQITRFNFMQNSSLTKISSELNKSDKSENKNDDVTVGNHSIDDNDDDDDVESAALKDDIISEQDHMFQEKCCDDDDVINNNSTVNDLDGDDSGDDVIDHVSRKHRKSQDVEKPVLSPELSNGLGELETSRAAYITVIPPIEQKRGGIVLEPLASQVSTKPKKSKSKKKRNKKTRSKSIDSTASCENNDHDATEQHESFGDKSNHHGTTQQLHETCGDENVLKASHHSNNTPDNVSLASFSSTANEGLTPSDIALKQLAYRCSNREVTNKIERYKRKINSSDEAWSELAEETNGAVLTGLFWAWLAFIQEPIITDDVLSKVVSIDEPLEVVKCIPREIWKLTECYLTVVVKLRGNAEFYERALRRFAVVVTSQSTLKDAKYSENLADKSTSFYDFLCNYAEVIRSRMDS